MRQHDGCCIWREWRWERGQTIEACDVTITIFFHWLSHFRYTASRWSLQLDRPACTLPLAVVSTTIQLFRPSVLSMSKSTDGKMDSGSPGTRLLQDVINTSFTRTPLPLDRDSGTELYRQHSHKVGEMQNPKMERVTSSPQTSTSTSRRSANGYMPIEDYGLIGNMRTCAMVATDGGIGMWFPRTSRVSTYTDFIRPT